MKVFSIIKKFPPTDVDALRGMSIHHPKALLKIVKAITTLQEPHNFILTSYHAGGGN